VLQGSGILRGLLLDNPTANGYGFLVFFRPAANRTLLKILSLLLDSERPRWQRNERPADIPAAPKVEDEIIQANLRKAITTPARSVPVQHRSKYTALAGEHKRPRSWKCS